MPLMVGVDRSEPNLEAVGWAAREAALHTMPLHLVHAAGPGSGRVRSGHRGLGAGRRGRPGLRLSSDVPRDDAVSALVGEGRRAFVLVVGARGRGELPGLLLVSVGLAVAARVVCPVVVVRGSREHQNGRFGRIVVGVEDGAESDTAVEYALREAHVRRCELIAVHAWSSPLGAPPEPPPGSWYALEAHHRPPAQVLDDALRDPEKRYPDATVSRRMVEGRARRALPEAAAEADLLIVGAGQRRGRPGLQLGVINHALLHHAPCPVMVVPRK